MHTGSTVTSSTSPMVIKQVDTKEALTVSSSKMSVTRTEGLGEEKPKQLGLSTASVETKKTEKTATKKDSSVAKVKGKSVAVTLAEDKSSTETSVVEQIENAATAADEKLPLLSKTTSAKAADAANDVEVASVSSISKLEPQPTKKTKKESTCDDTQLKGAKKDLKEIVVLEREANVTIATGEKLPDSSKTTTTSDAKSDNIEVSTVSIQKPVSQSSKKSTKDLAHDKARVESAKADSTSMFVDISDAGDRKHADGVQETQIPPVESDKKLTKATTLPKTAKCEDTSELRAKEQTETADSPKPSKSRIAKDQVKEDKLEVTSAVEEEQTTSVTVVIKQTKNKLESEEEGKSSRLATDADTRPKVKPETKKENQDIDKSNKVSEVSAAGTAAESDEVTDEVSSSIRAETKCEDIEVAVNGAVDERVTTDGKETSEAKLSLKKKSKRSPADDKDTELKNVTADGPAIVNDTQPGKSTEKEATESSVVTKSPDLLCSVEATSKAGTLKPPVATEGAKSEKKVAENGPDKENSLPAAAVNSGEADSKLNGVIHEDEKMPPADDVEFRPRRNSIDEFIKRILAEAREEQKKILDRFQIDTIFIYLLILLRTGQLLTT